MKRLLALTLLALIAYHYSLAMNSNPQRGSNYYEILGVSKNASTAEINRAYRKLAFKYHPDKNRDANAEDIMKTINDAHDVLSNPDKRKTYDRTHSILIPEPKNYPTDKNSMRELPHNPLQKLQIKRITTTPQSGNSNTAIASVSVDQVNRALIEEWQHVNSAITKIQVELPFYNDRQREIMELKLNNLKKRRHELEGNQHVQTFITLMNQAPIREAIPVKDCISYLRPGFVDFIYTHAFEHFLLNVNAYTIAWSPDGTKLAMASAFHGSTIWDTNTGTLLSILQPNGAYSVAWSPDGTKLATTSPNSAMIWNTNTGTLLSILPHNSHAVAWSPDGTKLVTYDGTGDAIIWDANTGARTFTLFNNGSIYLGAWSPDGTKLATGSHKDAKIWDANTGTVIRTFRFNDSLFDFAWSPDGTKLATGSRKNAMIWDTHIGALVFIREHNENVKSVAWSPDGTKLATRSGNTAKIWSTNNGKLLLTLQHKTPVREIAWNADGTEIVTGATRGLNIWNANTGGLIFTVQRNLLLFSIVWNPDGTKLATGSTVGVKIWDLEELARIKKLLESPDQCDLMRAFDMAIQQKGRIQATLEQWSTFKTFPEKIQQALKLYIKQPTPVSMQEREAALKKRRQNSSSTTQPAKEQ